MPSLSTVDPSEAPYSVAVVDDDPKLRTRLAMQLGESARAAAFASLAAVEQRAISGALVLVVGPSHAGAAALEDIARMVRGRSDLSVLLVADELTTDVLRAAMRAGVRDVVPLSTDSAQLLEAVQRAGEALQVRHVAPSLVAVDTDASKRGRTITVFSTKGGAGKSFVATNLGATLARRSDRPVVVVDADLQFGDVAVMLGVVPQHTIVDAVNQIDRLDESLLRSMLIKHEQSGMFVLAAPMEPAFADSVNLLHLQRILEVLSSFCGYVIIDTPARFDDIVLGLLESTDDIVLLAGMDIPHIKNTKIGLQTLRLLHIPSAKVKLVLNRANSKVKLDVADVERTLQMKADCLLPSEIAVPQSINKAVPVVLDAPRSGVARNLERLAALFPAHDPGAGVRR
ncbi:MAG TPA: AAA family ATPase [Acidimicrobiales bacterium]|nr:AAA family ATPase [Acidimicrobiales bacterium]